MLKNQNHDAAPQHVTQALASYEEAVKEFSTHATEFLEHVSLLTRARDAYQRAITASAELRRVLDKGDETLRSFMTQIQESVGVPIDNGPDERKREQMKGETIKASGDKADAARV